MCGVFYRSNGPSINLTKDKKKKRKKRKKKKKRNANECSMGTR